MMKRFGVWADEQLLAAILLVNTLQVALVLALLMPVCLGYLD
jgi:hypothetical protein